MLRAREKDTHKVQDFAKLVETIKDEYYRNIARMLDEGLIRPEALSFHPTEPIPEVVARALLRAHKRRLSQERELVEPELTLERATKEAETAIKEVYNAAKKGNATSEQKYNALRALNNFILALAREKDTVPYKLLEQTLGRWNKLAEQVAFVDYSDIALALLAAARKARTRNTVDLGKMATAYGALLPQLTVGSLSSPWLPHIAANIYNILVLLTRKKPPRELLKSEYKQLLREFLLLKQRGGAPRQRTQEELATAMTTPLNRLWEQYAFTFNEAMEFLIALLLQWKLMPAHEFVPGVILYGVRGVGKSTLVDELGRLGFAVVKLSAASFNPEDIFLTVKSDRTPQSTYDVIKATIDSICDFLRDTLPQEIQRYRTARETEEAAAQTPAQTETASVISLLSPTGADVADINERAEKIAQALGEKLGIEQTAANIITQFLLNDMVNAHRLVEEAGDNYEQFVSALQQDMIRYKETKYTVTDRNFANSLLSILSEIRPTNETAKFINDCLKLYHELTYTYTFGGEVAVDYLPLRKIAEQAGRDLILFVDELGYRPRFAETLLTLMTAGLLGTVQFNKVFVIAASNLPTEGIVGGLLPAAQTRFITIMLVPEGRELTNYMLQLGARYLIDSFYSLAEVATILHQRIASALQTKQQQLPKNAQSALQAFMDNLQIITERINTIPRTATPEERADVLLDLYSKLDELVRVYNDALTQGAFQIIGVDTRNFGNMLQQAHYSLNTAVHRTRIPELLREQMENSPLYHHAKQIVSSIYLAQSRVPAASADVREAAAELHFSLRQFQHFVTDVLARADVSDDVREMLLNYVLAGAPTETFAVSPNTRAYAALPAVLASMILLMHRYNTENRRFEMPENLVDAWRYRLEFLKKGIVGFVGEHLATEIVNALQRYAELNPQELESQLVRLLNSTISAYNTFIGATAEEEKTPLPFANAFLQAFHIIKGAPQVLIETIKKNFGSAEEAHAFHEAAQAAEQPELEDELRRAVNTNNAAEMASAVIKILHTPILYEETHEIATNIIETLHQQYMNADIASPDDAAPYLSFLLSLATAASVELSTIISKLHTDYIWKLLHLALSGVSAQTKAPQAEHTEVTASQYAKWMSDLMYNIFSQYTKESAQTISNLIQQCEKNGLLRFVLIYLHGERTSRPFEKVQLPITLEFGDGSIVFDKIPRDWWAMHYGSLIAPTIHTLTGQVGNSEVLIIIAYAASEKIHTPVGQESTPKDEATINEFIKYLRTAEYTSPQIITIGQIINTLKSALGETTLRDPRNMPIIVEWLRDIGWNDAAIEAFTESVITGRAPTKLPEEAQITMPTHEQIAALKKRIEASQQAIGAPTLTEEEKALLRKAVINAIINALQGGLRNGR